MRPSPTRLFLFGLLSFGLVACGGTDGLDEALVGTYVLDTKSYEAEALARRRREGRERLDQQEPGQRRVTEASWKLAAEGEAKRTAMQMVLRADGRFQTRFAFGRERGSGAGDWTRVGNDVVFSTQVENGRRLAKAYETRAGILDRALRMSGPRVPIPFTLRRGP